MTTDLISTVERPEQAPQSLWRNSDFCKFWFGETMSLYGTQVSRFAIPVAAIALNANPATMGLLRSMDLLPYLAFALIFGVWVDRLRLRPILIATNVVRMILVGAVPVLAWFDLLTVDMLLIVAFAIGTASVMFDVTWMSYVPVLIKDRRLLLSANSKLGITAATADAAGPGLGGILVQLMRAPFALCIDALTYLASLVSLVLIRAVEPPRAVAGEKRQLRAELVAGLRFVFGDKYLRNLAIVGFSCNFVVTGHSSLFILYAVQSGLAPGMVGLTLSVSALGAVAGAALARRLVKRFPCGIVYSCAFGAVFLAPLVLVSAQGDQAVLIAMFIVTYLLTFTGLGLANVLVMSIRQGLTPAAFMGRMNAAMRTLLFGGGALGAVIVGELANVVGLRAGLSVLALASAIIVVPVALSPVGRLRFVPESPDDREPPRPGPRHLRSTGRPAGSRVPRVPPVRAPAGRHLVVRERQGRHRDRRPAERHAAAR